MRGSSDLREGNAGCTTSEAPGGAWWMPAFPLRASTRYPRGFDAQTLGIRAGLRQTFRTDCLLGVWIFLGKAWGQRGGRLWNVSEFCCE